jgi:hypothetical protein
LVVLFVAVSDLRKSRPFVIQSSVYEVSGEIEKYFSVCIPGEKNEFFAESVTLQEGRMEDTLSVHVSVLD